MGEVADDNTGQKQRAKLAALEAQAKSQGPQHPAGGVQVLESFPGLASIASSELLVDGPIEETVRGLDNFGFPEMDFGRDSLDVSLFQGSS